MDELKPPVTIQFSRTVHSFLTRSVKTTAFNFSSLTENILLIQAINSRYLFSPAFVELPFVDIPKVIQALAEMYRSFEQKLRDTQTATIELSIFSVAKLRNRVISKAIKFSKKSISTTVLHVKNSRNYTTPGYLAFPTVDIPYIIQALIDFYNAFENLPK